MAAPLIGQLRYKIKNARLCGVGRLNIEVRKSLVMQLGRKDSNFQLPD
jgi:hypothetical protein